MRSFRGLRYFLAPPWLTGTGDGEKIAFTLEWMLDAFLERARQGLESRFPTRAGASALNLIIGDRGILRGRSESAASIASRLLAWRTPRTHRVRGNAYEALLQVWHYWGGIYAATIDAHGLRHEIEATDTPDVNTLADPDTVASWTSGGLTQWDGANANTNWSRFWLVLRPTVAMGVGAQPDLGDPALWGGALATPGYTLGQTGVLPEDVAAMRALFQELKWGPVHAQAEWLVFSLDPVASPVPAPDGNWRYWSKDSSGTRVASRVTPALSFTHAASVHRNGAGSVNIPLPAAAEGDLFAMLEARSGTTFPDAAPAGWTTIATRTGSFESARLYARLALDPGSEPATFSYTVTGSDDHKFKVSTISAPPGGWNANVASNFADIVTTAFGASPLANPNNADEQHRLNFLINDFFDTPGGTVTTGYTELYDDTGEINLQLSHATTKVTGSTSTFSGNGAIISVRLVYNLAWRFWSLDPARNNTYGGDRSRTWPAAATQVDGTGTYTGDRSDAGSWGTVTLPSGASYKGVRGSFPVRVLLHDDGGPPY